MKKLSLLLALLLVLTTGVFAACEDEKDETSGGGAVVDTDGDKSIPSTPDAGSSDADSSDPSSSVPSIDEVTKKLISQGMEYTYPTNTAGTHGARDYTGKLTDGVIPEKWEYGNAQWFGLFNNAGATDGSPNAILGWGDFVFDLGAATELAQIRVCNGNDNSLEQCVITVYTSNDGNSWDEGIVLTAGENVNAVIWHEAVLLGKTAQYVKVSATCPGNTYWSFLGEIEIYAVDAQ